MKKVLIICLLFLNILNTWADGEWKAWLQNVVNTSLNKNTVNWFKSLQVNDMFSWAGVFRLDINLPKWIKNDNLDLTLNYNSYSTESFNPFWYAWDLNLQPITRSAKKWVNNLYNSSDFFADWNDLVLIDKDKSIFKQKNSWSLSKYIYENGYWKVYDTNWNTYYYWNDDFSKLDNPKDKSKIFAWYLTKKVDIRWNEIEYSYFKDKNQVYLKEINYVYSNNTPLYSIKFDYLDKKISSTSFRTQFEVKTSKLLSDIKVYVWGTLWKQYNFSYDSIDKVFSHLLKVELQSNGKNFQSYDFSYWTWKDMHLLTNIKTSKGLNIDFKYTPASFYKDNGKMLNPKLPFNVKTLSNITYIDSVTGNKLSEDYSYEGWFYYYNSWDIYAREYAWFSKVKKSDNLWKTEIYYFHQWQWSFDGSELWEYNDNINKKWLVYRYELLDNLWIKYNQKITKWDYISNNDWTYRVLPIQVVDIFKDNTTKANLYNYDNYWQLLTESQLWTVKLLSQKWDFLDIEWDEKYINKTYAKNIDKNLFNFLSSEKILDNDNNILSRKEYFYDNLFASQVNYWNLTNTISYVDDINYIEEKNEYNSNWLLIKSIKPKGNFTSFIYDNYWLFATKVVNARWYEENYLYDYLVWKPKSFIDVNHVNYLYEYDVLWRNISQSVIDDYEKVINSLEYNDVSIPNFVKEITNLSSDWNDNITTYYYLDALWNPIQSKRKYKDKYVTTYMEYDSYGRKTYDYYKQYEDNYLFSNKKDDLKWDKYSYDLLNRITNINNLTWDIKYEYTDLWFTIYNQKNIATKYSYDIYWNLVEVLENNDLKTNYDYNLLWNLTNITRLWIYERNFSYDKLWRRLKAEELHKIWTDNFKSQYYSYDNNSNLVSKSALSWNTTSYTYDDLDRLNKSISSDINVVYYYDEWVYNKLKLTWIDNGTYKERYDYDKYWQITVDKKIYTDKQYVITNNYPFIWLKSSITYPDWKTLWYNYVDGVLDWIVYDWKNITSSIDYNPNFYIDKLVYWNPDLVELNTYDYWYNYRLVDKSLIKYANSESVKLSDISYEYDSIGSIIKSKEIWGNYKFQKEVNYTYDDQNRLLSVKYLNELWSEQVNYSYDDLWNILFNSGKWNYTYNNDLPERLEKITNLDNLDEFYSYDYNGNIITYHYKNYVYNTRDELTSFYSGTWTLTKYIYDEWGTRVEKIKDWVVDRYINKIYEEETVNTLSGSYVKVTKYIDLNWKKIASIERINENPEKVIYHQNDYLWSASIDLDENLNTLQQVDYYPYGKLRNQEQLGDYLNKYLFLDKERDKENGLDYFEARYYDSEVGRFNSIDRVYWELGLTKRGKNALSLPQFTNAYSYSGNNPVVYSDESGEDTLAWDWTWNWAVKLVQTYVEVVVIVWTYIADKTMDYIDEKYKAKTIDTSSTTSSPPPNKGKKDDETKKDVNSKSKKTNQIQESISKWKAPKDVKRVDTWKVKGEQDHIHFKENNSALNRDWTWKHWEKNLSNGEKKWLESVWWKIPK